MSGDGLDWLRLPESPRHVAGGGPFNGIPACTCGQIVWEIVEDETDWTCLHCGEKRAEPAMETTVVVELVVSTPKPNGTIADLSAATTGDPAT